MDSPPETPAVPAAGVRGWGGRLSDLARRRRPLDAFHAGIALASVVGLVVVAPLFRSGLVPGNDVTGHLVRTRAGLDLLRHGHIDGWDPSFGVGNQEWLFYGPGFTWATAALRLCTFGLLSDAGALKVLAIGSFLAIPAATAFLADSLELGRAESGLAAITALLASSPFGVGMEGLFGLGLVPQQLAAALFLVLLGAVVRVLRAPSGTWMVLATLALTALVLTHLISVVLLVLMLVLLVPAVLMHDGRTIVAIRPLVTVGLVAAGLSAFWLVPLGAHRNLHGPVATWTTPAFGQRVSDIIQGHILFEPLAATAVVIGLAWGFARVGQGRVYAGIVAAGPLVALAVAHWSRNALPNELTEQLANRSLGLIGILLTLPLAAALAHLARRLGDWMDAGHMLVLLLVTLLAAHSVAQHDELIRTPPAPTMAASDAAYMLRRLVPDGARFVTMRNLDREQATTGVIQPDRWFAWKSDRATLNVFPLELSSAPSVAAEVDALGRKPPDHSAAALRRLGVSHVITLTSNDAAVLSTAPAFRPVWIEGELAILALRPDDDQPPPAALVTANRPAAGRLIKAGSQRVALELEVEQPATATIAVAWSPKWGVEVNDRDVPARRSVDGLIEVLVPAGRSRIDLHFGSDRWDLLGRSVSLLTVLALVVLAFRRLRRGALADT